jgi:hypothetical protein
MLLFTDLFLSIRHMIFYKFNNDYVYFVSERALGYIEYVLWREKHGYYTRS